jgi:hypothetical protein
MYSRAVTCQDQETKAPIAQMPVPAVCTPTKEDKPTAAADAKPDDKPEEPDAKDEVSSKDLFAQIGKLTVDLEEVRAGMASSVTRADAVIDEYEVREKGLLHKIADHKARQQKFADKIAVATQLITDHQAREGDMLDKLCKYKERFGDLLADEVAATT